MSLLADIIDGKHDGELSEITEAIRQRKKLNSSKNTAKAMATIKVGDVVVLRNLSPKYINGCTGKVMSKKRTKFAVRLDDGQYTGRFGLNVNVPATCIDKV
jgi:ribosomal protein L21E